MPVLVEDSESVIARTRSTSAVPESKGKECENVTVHPTALPSTQSSERLPWTSWRLYWKVFRKFVGFLGPGLMVSIAYMDPGNYSTDIQGGALKQYKLLFVILLSTIIALYLQVLAIKLGSVTGHDLARNCHDHLPRWINWPIWVLAEVAILSTDVAEVCGTAIALKLLFNIPLIGGVFITIADVMLVLLAWGPYGGMKAVRLLEYFITALLMAIVICFCVLVARIPPANVGQVFLGYLPSNALVTSGGITASAGIMGATVMPHSLYLGSGTVVSRVRDSDVRHGKLNEKESLISYIPSFKAIKGTLHYSACEVCFSLITMAIFVNSAILIVAGDVLYGSSAAQDADLFGLYDILKHYLGKGFAVLFMVALLCSGLSAGVICTLAGQMVGEGHINWPLKPWVRRLGTRIISLIPCVAIVATLGQSGLNQALNWSQVILTITLPFLMTPLIYLTSCRKVMTVPISHYENGEAVEFDSPNEHKSYRNNWISMTFGALLIVFIGIVVVYLLVDVGENGA